MPWLRVGDSAPMHPSVMTVLEFEEFDDRLLNEAFGFLVRAAALSAGYLTDYVISFGTAVTLAGASRVKPLLAALEFARLIEPVEIEGRRHWKIISDPEFIHLRLKEEIEFERQRKADNGRPDLVIPIRLRDGDACRYCGQVVSFSARKGRLAGTYDHREPGKPGTVETMVVACAACNASRKNDPLADKRLPLLPEPVKPYFSASTVEWVNAHPFALKHGIKLARDPKTAELRPGAIAPCHAEFVQPRLFNDPALGDLPIPKWAREPAPEPEAVVPPVQAEEELGPAEDLPPWGVAEAEDYPPAGPPPMPPASGPPAFTPPEPDPAPAPEEELELEPELREPEPEPDPASEPPEPPEPEPEEELAEPECAPATKSAPPEVSAGRPPATNENDCKADFCQIFVRSRTEALPTESESVGTGRDGTGRDGSGRDGTARSGPGLDGTAALARRAKKLAARFWSR